MPTIGEKLTGTSMTRYIPIEKRQRREYDGPGKRAKVMAYIKEHDGEIITGKDLMAVGAVNSTGEAVRYAKQLAKLGKLSRVPEGNYYRYYVGKRDVPAPRGKNSPVEITKPAAHVSRTVIDGMKLELSDFLYQHVEDEALGEQVRGCVRFIKHLEAKLEPKKVETESQPS